MQKKTASQITIEKLQSWIALQTPESIREIVFQGKLNRKKVANDAGINKRSFTGQNPEATRIFNEYEAQLREDNVLPPLSNEKQALRADHSEPLKYDPNENKVVQLQAENSALRAKILELEAQLARYKEFSEVLSEAGFYE